MMRALDLFSAAAGGWSLGLHRAGFVTIAACEIVGWRRILYSENFPHVRLYDDIRTLTAARLVSDLGFLPDIIVGSPPCQDISSANTKGKGIEGERSGLYLEAVRLVGDCRPRWFAFENSANLRTRGADRLLDALEARGYTCHACVVAAADIGANHERKRSWIIGFDARQLIDVRHTIPQAWIAGANKFTTQTLHSPADAEGVGYACGRSRRHRPNGHGAPSSRRGKRAGREDRATEMGAGDGDCGVVAEPWSDWNGGLAGHLRLDDGLSAWVADTRIALGGPRGTAAAGLIVEAFGDAVVPQIPEVIGRAILRTEAALDMVLGTRPFGVPDDGKAP